MNKIAVARIVIALTAVVAGLVACGGGSGGSSGSTTGSGSSFSLAGALTVNGGGSANDIPAGTQSIVLTDSQGHNTTFTNILVPLEIKGGSTTILRAGSTLLSGKYSSTTAICVDDLGNQGTVPLNSNGALARDTAIAYGTGIILPITAVGQLSFQNGVKVITDASGIGDNRSDVTVALTTSTAALPSGSGSTSLSGSVAFSGGGTLNTTLAVAVAFANSGATSSSVGGGGSTVAPSRSAAFTGTALGSSLPYTSALVDYSLDF